MKTETTTIRAPVPGQTTTTRTGKIARLPLKIREEINRRLEENEPGATILAWLNSLPETQKDGPITAQNLSNWRQGGYQDAVNEEERRLRLADLAANSADLLLKMDAAQLANYLTVLWLADFNFTMRAVLATLTNPMEQLKLQMECLKVIGKVQQRELQKDRQALAREKWQYRQNGPDLRPLTSSVSLPSSLIKVNQGESSLASSVGRVPPPGAGTSQIKVNPGKSSLVSSVGRVPSPGAGTKVNQGKSNQIQPNPSESRQPAFSLPEPAWSQSAGFGPDFCIPKYLKWSEQERQERTPRLRAMQDPKSPDAEITEMIMQTAKGAIVPPVKNPEWAFLATEGKFAKFDLSAFAKLHREK